MSYYSDHRVRAGQKRKWYESIDEKTMIAKIEVYAEENDHAWDEILDENGLADARIKYEVCSTCDGKGHHVNPSIDSHGISAEEFYEDPDFAEEYMSGRYDVPCYGCNGKRVEVVLDRDRTHPLVVKYIDDEIESDIQFRMEQEAERRMGA